MQAGTYFLCFENTEIMFSKRQCSKRIGHVSMFSQGILSKNIAMTAHVL